jgi:O-antigen ligase
LAAFVGCLALGAWTLWRAEVTFVAFLVLAAAFGGAAFGAGPIDLPAESPAVNDNDAAGVRGED